MFGRVNSQNYCTCMQIVKRCLMEGDLSMLRNIEKYIFPPEFFSLLTRLSMLLPISSPLRTATTLDP